MKQYMKRIVSLVMVAMLLFTSCLTCNTTTVLAAAKKPTKITLNYTSTSTYVGGKVDLDVKSVTPKGASKSVTWKSSDKKIATVSKDGVVKGKKAGTVTITVASKEKPSVKATCKVKVYKETKTLKLTTKTKYTLEVGDKKTLKAKVTSPTKGTQPIQWSSENSKIAKVDAKGKVTAVKAGTTNIVAKSGGKSIKTKITVTDSDAPTKITLNSSSKKTYVGDEVKLKVQEVTPGSAKKTVTWKSSDKEIASVSKDGVVTAKKAGTVTITATSTADTSVKATCKVKVYKATKTLKLETKESYKLKIGKTKTLKATVISPTSGAQPVKWSSENAKIAKVDSNGKVTAVKEGITYIIAKSGAKSVKTKIKVVDNEIPFYLSQTEITIENAQLWKIPVVNDPGDIEWKSKNKGIADVIDGYLFPLKEGTTKITGTSGSQSQ